MKNKRVAVLGAAGYIGSTLCSLLLDQGYCVKASDNFYKGSCDTLIQFASNPNFEFSFADVNNIEDVKKAVDDVDFIVNLASLVGFPICSKYPKLAEITIVGGAENIMKLKDKSTKLVYSSTGSVFGALGEVCTENSPTNPPSWYGKCKLAAENIYLSEPNNIKIHRYSTAFGVGGATTRVNLLVNDLVYQAVVNKNLTIFEADFKRTFVHVKDICSAIEFTVGNFDSMKYNLYNVGHPGLNMSKREVAMKIVEKTGAYITFAEIGKDADIRNYHCDFSRILGEGWVPKISMEQGIKELIKVTPMLTQWNRYN